jgi:hypothetical protein
MKKVFLILFFVTSILPAIGAEIAPEKREEINKLLQLTGMEKLMQQVNRQMISALKAQIADVPEIFWKKFEERADHVQEFIEQIIPLYDKYYTLEDLKAVNAFYSSPTGQKLLSTLPQIMQESMKLGQEWGERLGKEAAEEAARELKKKEAEKDK